MGIKLKLKRFDVANLICLAIIAFYMLVRAIQLISLSWSGSVWPEIFMHEVVEAFPGAFVYHEAILLLFVAVVIFRMERYRQQRFRTPG